MSMNPTVNPYVGLRPFAEADSRYFFGRDGQVDPMIDLLGAHRFLGVVGVSGSGKSSLVRAGLLPAMHAGSLPTGQRRWAVVDMKPRNQPIRNLAEALALSPVLESAAEGLGSRADFAEAALRNSSGGLADLVGQALAGERREDFSLLVLVDQFEEIFRFARLTSGDEADQLIRLLLAAADQHEVPIYVCLTMRSDFLGDCARFRGLPEHLNRSQFIIPRLERADLRAAIEGPARLAGTTVEPALVTRLLNDLGDEPNRLPLLQHALRRLWDSRHELSNACGNMTLASYLREVGTLDGNPGAASDGERHGALHRHVQEVFLGQSDPAARNACEKLFKALTELVPDNRAIRRPDTAMGVARLIWPELDAEAALVSVSRLTAPFRIENSGFLIPPSPPEPLAPDDTLDISHESLISHWETLGSWVREEAEDGKQLRGLRDDAERGIDYGNDKVFDKVAAWWDKRNPSPAWAERYVPGSWAAISSYWEKQKEAARRRKMEAELEREKQKRRKKVFAGTLACIVTLIATFSAVSTWFYFKAKKSEGAAQQALANSFVRSIGRSSEETPSLIELDSLWELAELPEDQEVVRTKVLEEWFSPSDGDPDPLPALRWEQAGIRAATGLDQSRLNWSQVGESLIEVLENPDETDSARLASLTNALAGVSPKLDVATAGGFADRLAKALADPQSTSLGRLSPISKALAEVSVRLDPGTVNGLWERVADRLIEPVKSPGASFVYLMSSGELLARMSEELEAKMKVDLKNRLVDRLVEVLVDRTETDQDRLLRAEEALVEVSDEMDADSAGRLAERLLKALEDPQETDPDRISGLSGALVAVAPKLEAVAAGGFAERVVKALKNSEGANHARRTRLVEVLAVLSQAQEIDPAEVVALWTQVMDHLVRGIADQETDVIHLSGLPKVLAEVAPTLSGTAAATLAEPLIKALENPDEIDPNRLSLLSDSLTALSLKLDVSTRGDYAQRLVTLLEKPEEIDVDRLTHLPNALAAMTSDLDRTTQDALAERLILALEQPGQTNADRILHLAGALVSVLPRSDPASEDTRWGRSLDRLLGIVENPSEHEVLQSDLLSPLVRTLENGNEGFADALAGRLVNSLIDSPSLDSGLRYRMTRALKESAESLNPATADALTEQLTRALENPLETDGPRLSQFGSSLAAMVGKGNATTAATLAERLVTAVIRPKEANPDRLAQLTDAFLELSTKLDATAADRIASRLLKALINPQETVPERLELLAGALASLLPKLEAASALRIAEQLVAALENPKTPPILHSSHEKVLAMMIEDEITLPADLLGKIAMLLAKSLSRLETDEDHLSLLARSLATVSPKVDAATVGGLSDHLVKVLENPQEFDADRLRRMTDTLASMSGKLEAAAAEGLADRLAKALENPQEANVERLQELGEAFAYMTEKLGGNSVDGLADLLFKALEEPQGTSEGRIATLTEALAAISPRMGASKARDIAGQLVNALDDPKQTDPSRVLSREEALISVSAGFDTTVPADLWVRVVDRLVKVLSSRQEDRDPPLARVLAVASGKMEGAATVVAVELLIGELAGQLTDPYSRNRLVDALVQVLENDKPEVTEVLVKALENRQQPDAGVLNALVNALIPRLKAMGRAEAEPLAARVGIALYARRELGNSEAREAVHSSLRKLPDHFPDSCRKFKLWVVDQYFISGVPEAPEQPTDHEDDDEARNSVRALLQGLSLEELVDALKWPLCGGAAQTLVLSEIEEKLRSERKAGEFYGDVWRFVELAPSLGVTNLKSPPHRPSLEMAVKELEEWLEGHSKKE